MNAGVSLIDQIPIMDSYYPAVPDEELKLHVTRNVEINTDSTPTNETGSNPIVAETNDTACDAGIQMEDQCNETEVIAVMEAGIGTSAIEVADNASAAMPELCDAQNSAGPEMQNMGNDAPVLVAFERHTSAVHQRSISTEILPLEKRDAEVQCNIPKQAAGISPEEVRVAIAAEM